MLVKKVYLVKGECDRTFVTDRLQECLDYVKDLLEGTGIGDKIMVTTKELSFVEYEKIPEE